MIWLLTFAFGAIPQIEDYQKMLVSKPVIPWTQEAVARFVDKNRETLSFEMAQGSGAKITELSQIAGCNGQMAQSAFQDMIKGSYDKTLVTEPEVTADEVASNIKELIQEDQAVASVCFF